MICGLILLGPVGLIIILVAGFIGLVFGLPAVLFMNCVSRDQFQDHSCCWQFCVICLLIVICIVCSPVSLVIIILGVVGVILCALPYGIYMVVVCIRER